MSGISALIVHAHPEPASFSSAQAQVARSALEGQGYAVRVVDLYAEGWNAVLDSGEFARVDGAFKPQREQWNAVKSNSLRPEVRAGVDAVLEADLLVLSFPLWWFSVPAILKGWIDRVFVMGAVFGGDLGVFEEAALAGKRAVVLATTGGEEGSFAPEGDYGDIGDFLFHVHRGMLEFVGYEVLQPVVTYGPARRGDTERAHSLRVVHEAFSAIAHRPLAASKR